MTSAVTLRRLCLDALAAALLLLATTPVAMTQQPKPLLELRPHCEEADQSKCASFDVASPTTMRTQEMAVGMTLDMDIIVRNPASAPISAVRSWLSYDAEVLEGVSITLDPAFSIPIPGEGEFSPADGFAKIGAATEEGKEPAGNIIRVARVQFTVRQPPTSGVSPIGFHDIKPDGRGHTAVIASNDPTRQNMVTDQLGSLLVRIASSNVAPANQSSSIAPTTASSQAAQVGSSAAAASSATPVVQQAPASSSAAAAAASSVPGLGTSSSAAPAPVASTPFNLLQVQNLRVTSEKTTLYLAWDKLNTPRLQGYNVYYGTQMGRYIQRRSLPATAISLSIRDLPLGTAYYASVRAVDDKGIESAFSQEAGVEIGNPNTSTSPLLAIPPEGGQLTGDVTGPKNPLDHGTTVPGESGSSSVLLLLLGASAAIGMAVALRRQFIAISSSGHS
jgi:hypothetical protein